MQTVKVRLRKPTRVFTFLCPDIPLERNDPCVVRSDRGLEYGVCVLPGEPCPDSMQQLVKMNVLRKATHTDQSNYLQLQVSERQAFEVCQARIRKHGLPMKLVDAEYTFDKHKVVFYFTAAERVDFRELVRDLAKELRTRIELRHIQVRDEAKLTGGLGVCGRELCCATWLAEFKPISMKMAKRQNLSLNPSKISGQCGRLLCCLSYENDQYDKRRKPKPATAEESGAVAAAVAPEPVIDEEVDLTLDEEPVLGEAILDAEDAVEIDDESPETEAAPGEARSQDETTPSGERRRPRKRRRRRKRPEQGAGASSAQEGPRS